MIITFLMPLKGGEVRRQHDHYNPNAERIDWNPLFSREIYESLFEPDEIGRHNVRVGKETTEVQREVYETITDEPQTFWGRHNGFVILAESRRTVRNGSDEYSEVSIDTDRGPQGMANGNSSRLTFKRAVLEFDLLGKIERGEITPPQLHFEVWTGLSVEEMVSISAKRNEQYAVSESSVLNHDGAYDIIKDALKNDRPKFDTKIAYKQNEKGVPIDNITQSLMAMDFIEYPDGVDNPYQAQTSRSTPRKHFLEHSKDGNDSMSALMPVVGDILVLHDTIRAEFMEMYKRNSTARGYRYYTKEFILCTGISEHKRSKEMPFAGLTAAYDVPLALSIPTLAAFRQLLEQDEHGKAYWALPNGFNDVLALWHQVGPTLTKKVVERCYKAGKNLAMAKDPDNWAMFYDKVTTAAEMLPAEVSAVSA